MLSMDGRGSQCYRLRIHADSNSYELNKVQMYVEEHSIYPATHAQSKWAGH